jgi:hypothetical protein
MTKRQKIAFARHFGTLSVATNMTTASTDHQVRYVFTADQLTVMLDAYGRTLLAAEPTAPSAERLQ